MAEKGQRPAQLRPVGSLELEGQPRSLPAGQTATLPLLLPVPSPQIKAAPAEVAAATTTGCTHRHAAAQKVLVNVSEKLITSRAVNVGRSSSGGEEPEEGARHLAQRQGSLCAEGSTPQGQRHDREAQPPPAWRQVAVLLLCWGIFAMFTLLLSCHHRCSSRYWVIFGVQAAACIGAEALFVHLVSVILQRLPRQEKYAA